MISTRKVNHISVYLSMLLCGGENWILMRRRQESLVNNGTRKNLRRIMGMRRIHSRRNEVTMEVLGMKSTKTRRFLLGRLVRMEEKIKNIREYRSVGKTRKNVERFMKLF